VVGLTKEMEKSRLEIVEAAAGIRACSELFEQTSEDVLVNGPSFGFIQLMLYAWAPPRSSITYTCRWQPVPSAQMNKARRKLRGVDWKAEKSISWTLM
jgi:hypothetical protein